MAIGIYFSPAAMSAAKYDECIKLLKKAGAGNPAGRSYGIRQPLELALPEGRRGSAGLDNTPISIGISVTYECFYAYTKDARASND